MADSKITALTAISTVDPTADPLVIVDVSDTSMAASGTTKKSTINQLLGAGGTATLASATISGDLTVDTSTLKVDSALNNVGIGTASPNNNTNRSTLTINNGTWGGQLDINVGATNHASFGTDNFDSGASCRLQSKDSIVLKTAGTGASSYLQLISSTGVTTWYDGAGGTRMTLNATGLGVGASPAQKLTVAGSAEITGGVVGQGALIGRDGSSGGGNYGSNTGNTSLNAPAGGTLRFNVNNGTFGGQFDTSGNLILNSVATPPTLTINGQLVANATSNTNLRFSYRGSDGITRVANITLA